VEEDEQVGFDAIFWRSVDGPESAIHGGQVRFRVGHVALDRPDRQVRCFHLDLPSCARSRRVEERVRVSLLLLAACTALDGQPTRQDGAPASVHQAHEAYRH
jgi:hypothetical protein